MSNRDHDDIIDAAIRILLEEDRQMTISFSPGGIAIRFPTTRRLAEYLGIPHYYVLPQFGAMERDGLITRIERVGISTTPVGTELLLKLMTGHYQVRAEEILGEEIFQALQTGAGGRG
ncbi:MAG: hypothetical protein GX885_07950 [Methanomicrobiales archaeon]|nr:hypothetical protein [Methanomicrobiales archaeon]